MAERGASGEFDYLIGDLTGVPSEPDSSTGGDALPQHATRQAIDHPPRGYRWDEPEERVWVSEPDGSVDGSFDAFDDRTWYFEPAPAPWYRTKQSLTVLIATAAAAIALVVSGVLLLFRGPSTTVDNTTSVTPTAPTTVASSESAATSPEPPPPPPPPPPPETSAAPVVPPVQTIAPRTPRTTKEPEIGVTRTPVTRSPFSVAPQRPGNLGQR